MLEVRNLSFSYKGNGNKVLDDVSFSLESGSFAAVLGNNGVGKSTLLKCIDRIIKPGSGTVTADGRDLLSMKGKELAKHVAYVAQDARKTDASVFDAVLLGRKPYIKWDASEEDYDRVSDMLKKLDLEDYALRSVSTLSGGEAQKVTIARALVQEPRILLLDEPTSSLDPRNQHDIMKLVRSIAKEQDILVVCVIHDLNLAIRYCDRYIFMKDGKVFAAGGREVMTPDIIEEVYNMHTHITECMGIPVIVPFPDEPVEHHRHEA